MNFLKSNFDTLTAVFMVSGTCIGAGMIALPVSAGRFGLMPALIMMGVAWCFMMIGGIYLADVMLVSQKKSNHLVSLSMEYLGSKGRNLVWLVYTFIGITSFVAYLSEGGRIINDFFSYLGFAFSIQQSYILYLVMFIALISFGSFWLCRINSILFSFMSIIFLGLVSQLIPYFHFANLFEIPSYEKHNVISLLPLMLTIFSYPGVVPGVVQLVKFDKRKIKYAILGGTLISLIFYVIWLVLILGIITSSGDNNLSHYYELDRPITAVLADSLSLSKLPIFAQAFGFLAITTSFVALGWSLNCFFQDGFMLNGLKGRLLISVTMAVITFVIVNKFEKLFFSALELSGGIGDSLVSGLIPVMMAFVARYRFKYIEDFSIRFNKFIIIGVKAFFGGVIVIELINCFY